MALLLLRYGELWLKSFEVRRRFTDRLVTNLQEGFASSGAQAKILCSRDRIFVEVADADAAIAEKILSHTFGLVSFSPVVRVPAEKEAIIDAVMRAAKETICLKDTFAIRCQRSGKHEFTSSELERECGAEVVRVLGNKVNLKNPAKTVYVDVRGADAYVFSKKIPALGGLPLGVEGKVIVEFARDLDRNLAASFVMMKRGCRILPVFAKDGRTSEEAVGFLRKFDPNAKPYFADSKNLDAFAVGLCRKKKAGGIVRSEGVQDFCAAGKLKNFDKKTGTLYLYPLVGYTEAEMDRLCKALE